MPSWIVNYECYVTLSTKFSRLKAARILRYCMSGPFVIGLMTTRSGMQERSELIRLLISVVMDNTQLIQVNQRCGREVAFMYSQLNEVFLSLIIPSNRVSAVRCASQTLNRSALDTARFRRSANRPL